MRHLITALIGAAILAVTMSAADARPQKRHHHRIHHVQQQPVQEPSFFGGFQSGFFAGSGLVQKARGYLGATAREVGVRHTLWCSAFLRKLTGRNDVDDRAKSWESRPRIAPQVGAVVTMSRGKRGGHVGVVSGFTKNGDPIVISGNHNGRVAESVYPRSRIRAWVSAS